MSSSSSMTPKNRRTTLSSLPMPSVNRRKSIDPASAAAAAVAGNLKNPRRLPKGRVSMIPRVGGRENHVPPSTPIGESSSSATTASSRRRSIAGDGLSNSSSSSNHKNNTNRSRQSLAPPSSSNSSVGQRSDPRQINDTDFQRQCIKQLLSFLQESGYEYPVSSKSLSRPSAKDFTNITTFLLRRVDTDFQRGGIKFEDEVALNFKCMGYPYPISKTALAAAGSPHTWPALLAALTWLMQQLQSKMEHVERDELDDNVTGTPFESLHDLETQTDKAFFQYMGQAYVAFMQGDAAATLRLETAFMQRFERDDAFLEQAVERVTDINASLVENINEAAQKAEDLPVYVKKREDYATDLEQFHDLLRQMDEHKTAMEQKVKERTTELAETNGKLDRMTTHINELKQAIQEQEFSVNDIHKMESELKGLSEATDRAYAVRHQRREMLLASEQELVILCNDLESVAVDYNGRVAELQLVPELASKFVNMKAKVNKDGLLDSDQSHVTRVDLVGNVQPIASSSKQEYIEKLDRAKAQYQDFLDQRNRADEACKEADAKMKIVEDKKSKCEQTLEAERKTLQAKLAVREREVVAMENKIAALQDPVALEEQMAAFERQCAELEALRIEHEEDNIAKCRAVLSEVNTACQLMADHDAYLRHRVAQVNAHWQEITEQLGDIVAPTNIDLARK